MSPIDAAHGRRRRNSVAADSWIHNCYEKVSYPNKKSEDFLLPLNKRLSNKLRGEFDNPVKQQALFSLLGEDYVKLNFPRAEFKPSLLEAPKTAPELKRAYLNEMEDFLLEQIKETQEDIAMPEDVSTYEADDRLGEFVREIRAVYQHGLDREVRLRTKRDLLENNQKDDGGPNNERAWKTVRKYFGNENKEAEEEQDNKEQDEENKTRTRSRSPIEILTGEQTRRSEVPGEAFVTVTDGVSGSRVSIEGAKDMFRKKNLMLPKAMRELLWEECIFATLGSDNKRGKRIRKPPQFVDMEKCREKFRSDVGDKIDLKKMERAVQSSDYRKIYSVIIDCYHTTTVMKPVAEDSFMLQAAHVINVLSVKNRHFSNAQIFLLVPLQLVFPQKAKESEEKCITRLANDLNLLWHGCHLPWFDVFDVAEDVIRMAVDEDREYVDHLIEAIGNRISVVDVYDFAGEILDKNTTRSAQIWNELYRKKKRDWRDKDMHHFGNIEIYIRKWLSEAFAGVLGGNSILYIWDVLFLHNWSKDIFRQIALALLFLLKPWAMKADNHRKLSRVLMEEPHKIYIGDLRIAVDQARNFAPMTEVVNTNHILVEDYDEVEVAPVPDEKPLVEETGRGLQGVAALAAAANSRPLAEDEPPPEAAAYEPPPADEEAAPVVTLSEPPKEDKPPKKEKPKKGAGDKPKDNNDDKPKNDEKEDKPKKDDKDDKPKKDGDDKPKNEDKPKEENPAADEGKKPKPKGKGKRANLGNLVKQKQKQAALDKEKEEKKEKKEKKKEKEKKDKKEKKKKDKKEDKK